jgi:hypothetical protein
MEDESSGTSFALLSRIRENFPSKIFIRGFGVLGFWAGVDETEEFVELAGVDGVQGMAGLAFDFYGPFDEQSLEE